MLAYAGDGALYYTSTRQEHLGTFRDEMGEQRDVYWQGEGALLRTDIESGKTQETVTGIYANFKLDGDAPVIESGSQLYFAAYPLPKEGEKAVSNAYVYCYDTKNKELTKVEFDDPNVRK